MTLNNFINYKATPNTGISVGCYAAVLEQYQRRFPAAHFEVVMRVPASVGLIHEAPSPLSPAAELLFKYKAKPNWAHFARDFERQMFTSPEAIKRMIQLRDMARIQEVFLVCCEKRAHECHRSLLKHFIDHLDAYLCKWEGAPTGGS